jgi:hypothetical protein
VQVRVVEPADPADTFGGLFAAGRSGLVQLGQQVREIVGLEIGVGEVARRIGGPGGAAVGNELPQTRGLGGVEALDRPAVAEVGAVAQSPRRRPETTSRETASACGRRWRGLCAAPLGSAAGANRPPAKLPSSSPQCTGP